MVQFVKIGNEKIIGTRVSAQIDPQDLDEIQEVVSKKIKRYKNLRWYYEMIDFEGWEMSSFWRDMVFSLMNTVHFNKIAFIGKNTPENIMAEVTSVFTPAQVKYFDLSEKKSALEWILTL